MKQLLLLFSISTLLSCINSNETDTSDKKNDSIIENNTAHNGLIKKTPTELTVNENCVIFLWPDSTEIEKIKAESDEETFNEIAADMTWYPGMAQITLDSFKIKSISCDQEYLILKNAKNKTTKLRRIELEADMILFRLDKDPVFSNSIDFDKDVVLKYFNVRN
jgi:hypothetical protein